MFNLMVTGRDDAWEEGLYVWDKSRILEYTNDAVREPLKALSAEALEELAKLPTLFMYERHTDGAPKVGAIKRVQQRGPEIRIIFEFDETVPPLTPEQIETLQWDLGLADFEFSRTHWAVKEGDLYTILREAGHLGQLGAPNIEGTLGEGDIPEDRPLAVDVTPTKVFLVHGRDEGAKHSVARFLERRVGLEVIILSERPNRGRSILTKFKEEAFVRFSRWSKSGVWDRLFATMADEPDFEYVMIDSTIVRAHQHAAGKKGGVRLVRSDAHAAG